MIPSPFPTLTSDWPPWLTRVLVRVLKGDGEGSSLLWAGNAAQAEERKGKLVKAALYGVQVFYSFFIM